MQILKQRHVLAVTAAFALAAGSVGCADSLSEDGGDDGSICEDARSHVQGCFPDRSVDIPDSCDKENAREMLKKDCDELGSDSEKAKADGFCNPWFAWTCDGEDDEREDDSDGYDDSDDYGTNDVWLHTDSCSTSACATVRSGPKCAKLTLENERGEVVETAFTESRGNVQVTDLPDGTYTLKLYRRDGSLGENIEGEPAKTTFEVGAGSPEIPPSITIQGSTLGGPGELAEYVRCTKGRFFLESTCDGAPMETEETEWSWIAQVKGDDQTPTADEYTRPFGIRGENQFVFTRLYEGNHELVFHEVEIPDYDRETNLEQEDYRDLVEDHATGRTVEKSVQVQASDIGTSETTLGRYELEHRQCR